MCVEMPYKTGFEQDLHWTSARLELDLSWT